MTAISRNGSGVYSLPPQYIATTGETITALQHNLPLTDIAADLNAVRPVSSGGTGASTASAARTALGLAIGSDVQAYNSRLAPLPAGVVMAWAGGPSAAPTGWLLCDGSAVSRTTYADLYASVSTLHGSGDGSTTFNLPDLRGRVVAGKDDMGGTSANRLTNQTGGLNGDTLGATGGAETHSLTGDQTGPHAHTGTTDSAGGHPISVNIPIGTISGSGGSFYQTSATSAGGTDVVSGNDAPAHQHTFTSNSSGSGTAHNNVQPTIILNYIIKT